MELAAEALAGAAGGAFSSGVLYPIEVLKNNIQASRPAPGNAAEESKNCGGKEAPGKSLINHAKDLVAEKGWSGIYRGVHFAMFESAMAKAFYFLFYSALQRAGAAQQEGWRGSRGGSPPPPPPGAWALVARGYTAEAARLPLTLPLEVIVTKIQTYKGPNNAKAYAIIQAILKNDGIAGFYKGWSAYVLLCLQPAIQFAVYEWLKRLVLAKESAQRRQPVTELTIGQAFFLGAISRGIATIVIFPCQRAKVLAMSSASHFHGKPANNSVVSGEDARNYARPTEYEHSTTRPAETKEITKRKRGFLNFYQGLGPEIFRGVLSAALMLATKEKIAVAVKRLVMARAHNKNIAAPTTI